MCHGSRRPKTRIGFSDAVGAEEGPVVLDDRSGASENPLVGRQRHPVRTAFDTRFVGTNPVGDAKRQPMLNGSARRKIEPERLSPLPRNIDGKIASAAGGQRKSETNLDEGCDELHLEKTVGLQRDPPAQFDRPENPGRAGQCLRAGMPALRQMRRDFLGTGGPRSGASPTGHAPTLQPDQTAGAGRSGGLPAVWFEL